MDFFDIISRNFILRKIKHVNFERLQLVLISNIDQFVLVRILIKFVLRHKLGRS